MKRMKLLWRPNVSEKTSLVPFIYLFILKELIFFSCVLFFILTSDDIASFDKTGVGGGHKRSSSRYFTDITLQWRSYEIMKKLWKFLKPDMELWTNKLLLSFKFDNSVKFDKPSYEIQQTDRRSRALPNTACALPPPPPRSRAKPTARQTWC